MCLPISIKVYMISLQVKNSSLEASDPVPVLTFPARSVMVLASAISSFTSGLAVATSPDIVGILFELYQGTSVFSGSSRVTGMFALSMLVNVCGIW